MTVTWFMDCTNYMIVSFSFDNIMLTITAPSLVSSRAFLLIGFASLEGLFVALLTSPLFWLIQTNCSLFLIDSSTLHSSHLRRSDLPANRQHGVHRYPDPKCSVASGKSNVFEIKRRTFLETASKVRREVLTRTPSPQALQRSIEDCLHISHL